MKAYIRYKEWWIDTQAPQLVPSLYWGNTEEDAFKQNLANMGLYLLMETLVEYEDK